VFLLSSINIKKRTAAGPSAHGQLLAGRSLSPQPAGLANRLGFRQPFSRVRMLPKRKQSGYRSSAADNLGHSTGPPRLGDLGPRRAPWPGLRLAPPGVRSRLRAWPGGLSRLGPRSARLPTALPSTRASRQPPGGVQIPAPDQPLLLGMPADRLVAEVLVGLAVDGDEEPLGLPTLTPPASLSPAGSRLWHSLASSRPPRVRLTRPAPAGPPAGPAERPEHQGVSVADPKPPADSNAPGWLDQKWDAQWAKAMAHRAEL
jgi:hypothetical protein